MYFGSKYRILPFRRKPQDTTPSLFSMLRSEEENPFPYSLQYAESQSSIITEEVFGVWERVNSFVIFKMPLALRTLQKLHIPLELPLNKANNGKFSRFLLPSFQMSSYCVQLTNIISKSHLLDIAYQIRTIFPNILTSIVVTFLYWSFY